jgi:hypothetical protein
MTNAAIEQRILDTLDGHVFSTSTLARKTGLSRITVAKYLGAMHGKRLVQSVRVGRSVAWRCAQHKPLVAIIARPAIARVAQLALGDRYSFALATTAVAARNAQVIITDSVAVARVSQIPAVLVGGHDESAWCIPEYFDPSLLCAIIRKLINQQNENTRASGASIVVEHLEELEEVLGMQKADELLHLVEELLRECKLPVRRSEYTAFLLDSALPEELLLEIEQTFALLLCHIYERAVQPGEQLTHNSITHTVPSLTITLSTRVTEIYEEE